MHNDLQKRFNPFPEKGYVFGKVIEVKPCSEEFIDYYEITIDIVNDEMRKYDKTFYNSDNYRNQRFDERPALYFYYVTIRTTDLRVVDFFERRQSKRYFKYYISRADLKNDDYLYDFFGSPFTSNDNLLNLVGDITFIASPAISNPYVITLTNEEADVYEPEIPGVCIIKDADLLNMKLSEIFGASNIIDKVNIYHVGSGYYSYFEYNDGSRFFYDIGLTKFSDREMIECPDHGYDNFKFGILSHWDQDHFMGITLHDKKNQDTILSMPWICPSIIDGMNAQRLAFQIRYRSNDNLIMIDQNIRGLLYSNPNLSLMKGYCYRGKPSEMKNANGIALFIKNEKKFVVLGDVGYIYLDKDKYPFDSTDYLVVPHHGSEKVGQVNIKPTIGSTSMAIVPVGKNPTTWGHPKESTLNSLIGIGYDIYQTNIKGSLIVKLGTDSKGKQKLSYLQIFILKIKSLLRKIIG